VATILIILPRSSLAWREAMAMASLAYALIRPWLSENSKLSEKFLSKKRSNVQCLGLCRNLGAKLEL